ncbi:DUF5674 family protein [Patescibacteria group bacterium]|nr:DUF5674 family protein [Patescibacteria group bacterium]MCL5091950.1 DUF5674 family protein [Patescibacteria group bacterium]
MQLIDKPTSLKALKKTTLKMFGGLIKAVVDVKKEIIVVNADMHADEERYLLEQGSRQDDLWGINLYPDLPGTDFIEFDSMINLRPRLNNFTRGINHEKTRSKVIKIINKLIIR